MGGNSDNSSSSSDFARNGGSTQTSSFSYGPQLASIINGNLNGMTSMDSAPKNFLTDLVDYQTGVPGWAGVKAGTELNPFSQDYENKTADMFSNRLEGAMADAQTGPEAVMAPLARGKSFREAEVMSEFSRGRNKEVRDERGNDAAIMLKSVENMIGQRLTAASLFPTLQNADSGFLTTAASLLGSKVGTNSENYSGKGNQGASGFSFGADLCCFIFLESYRGSLPWFVRFCRDLYITPRRRAGYVWMANWLVPLMRKSPLVRTLVDKLMVGPITEMGGWLCRVKGYEHCRNRKLITKIWFKAWDVLGMMVGTNVQYKGN